MPYYPRLKRSRVDRAIKQRTSDNLLKLKDQLRRDLPEKDLDQHLLLATWNIRDLGARGPKHGRRTIEDLFYIAEILSRFDLVAVQEVNDLEEWEFIMGILGRDWDYIATDISEWGGGGNGERMTFVFDKRKVWFENIAGEIVLSPANLITEHLSTESTDDRSQGRQFARTPFLVSYQAGWFSFDICTVHIYFGDESGAKLRRRIREIEGIAKEISSRAEVSLREKSAMLLLGDFNIVHPDHKTMESLKEYDFLIPEPLSRPSNIGGDKYYDQIAVKTSDDHLMPFLEDQSGDQPNAGIFELYDTIMTDDHWEDYRDLMLRTTDGRECETDQDFMDYFKTWKTYHLSDHKPMWVRIPIDKSEEYIENI